MKTFLTIMAMFFIFVSPVFSEDSPEVYCKSVSDLAREIMIKRQDNFSVVQLIDIAERGEAPIISKKLILEAYQEDVQKTDELKELAVDVFVNDVYTRCMIDRQ